jgi:hypothetical protein
LQKGDKMSEHGQEAIDFKAWEEMETIEPDLIEASELDVRRYDGITVRLMFANRVWVEVEDSKTGESFIVDVPEGANANEYFHHPYTYDRRADSTIVNSARQETA